MYYIVAFMNVTKAVAKILENLGENFSLKQDSYP